MKNYKVEATMKFTDKEENAKRNVGDIFETTKERYEFLKKNNAVKLIEIVEEIKGDSPYEENLQIDNDVKIEEKPKKRKSSKK